MRQTIATLLFTATVLGFVFGQAHAQQEILVSQRSGIESELTIAINPSNYDELIVSSMRTFLPIQVHRSNDGAETWTQTPFNLGVADPVLSYGDNGTASLVFLDFVSILRLNFATSGDNGATWTNQVLQLDSMAADRAWIRRDNSPASPHYGNTYVGYFHPQQGPDIHIFTVDPQGNIGENQSVLTGSYPYVQNCMLDVKKDGEIVLCFLSQHNDDSFNIMSVFSTDGAETFSPEVQVAPISMYQSNGNPVRDVVGFAPGAASRLQNSLQMAIDKSNGPFSGRAYLTWTDFVAGNPDEGMNVYLSYSDDLGVTWSTPSIVNDDNVASSHQYFSAISVNPTGQLAVSWYDRRSDPVDDALTDFYLSMSSDGGSTFSPSVKLNSATADHTHITQGQQTFGVGEYTSMATSESHAFAVWADGRTNDGNMAIYLSKVPFPTIEVVEPASFDVVHGVYASGGLPELANSDGMDLSASRSQFDTQSRITVSVDAISPTENPSTFSFTLESSVFARQSVTQHLEMFNFDSSSWETVDSRNASRLADSTVTHEATGDLSRFVEPGTMEIETRVRYVSSTARQRFSANIDQMIWEIGN
ncbi:MAG: sialidase family protein [Planctomycetota bacterium]